VDAHHRCNKLNVNARTPLTLRGEKPAQCAWFGFLTPQGGGDRLSRNVGKKLPILTQKNIVFILPAQPVEHKLWNKKIILGNIHTSFYVEISNIN